MTVYVKISGLALSLAFTYCFAQISVAQDIADPDDGYAAIYQEELSWHNQYIYQHHCLKEIAKAPYMVLFEPNEFKIPTPYLVNAQFTANCLKEHPQVSLIIEGFASREGDEISNNKLSISRAEAFQKELFKLGIEKSRTAIYGLGTYEKTPAHGWRSKGKYNRRVKLIPYVDIKRLDQMIDN